MLRNKKTSPILKETLESLKAIKPTLKERKRAQKLRKVSDKHIFENTKIPEHLSILQALKLL